MTSIAPLSRCCRAGILTRQGGSRAVEMSVYVRVTSEHCKLARAQRKGITDMMRRLQSCQPRLAALRRRGMCGCPAESARTRCADARPGCWSTRWRRLLSWPPRLQCCTSKRGWHRRDFKPAMAPVLSDVCSQVTLRMHGLAHKCPRQLRIALTYLDLRRARKP